MRHRFGWSSTGAIAPLTALLAVLIVNGAEAGDVASGLTPNSGAGALSCGAAGEGCARISGYIKAGADVSPGDPDGLHPRRLAPLPPLRVDVDPARQTTADAVSREMFLFDGGAEQPRVR